MFRFSWSFCGFSCTYSDLHWLLQLILSIYGAWFSDVRFGLHCNFISNWKAFFFLPSVCLELVTPCGFLQLSHLFSSASFHIPFVHFTHLTVWFHFLSLTYVERFYFSIMDIFLPLKGSNWNLFLAIKSHECLSQHYGSLQSRVPLADLFFVLLEAQKHNNSFNNC